MIIETIIKPRADGTVVVLSDDGSRHVFKPTEDGRLVADVPDEHAGWLLKIGNFFPAEPEDDVPPPAKAQDLSTLLHNLDKSGLLDYARQNDIEVDGRMSVATLRLKIAEAMQAESTNADAD